jgi:Trk K+ transport system NAD-binding subunit
VVANIDDATAKEFIEYFRDQPAIELFQGNIVDRNLLKKAGISKATKVIILAETESGKSFEEIDSQTVLAAMMIVSLNKKAYKVAEILDKRYKESLEQANVEEIYLEDEFTRIMLSNGSHGVGITRVISELVNFRSTSLRTRKIEDRFVNLNFKQLIREKGKPGELIIGLLEETGNINVRKSERIQQAQIQSNIRGQVEELIKVKELKPNRVIIAPDSNYVIPPNSQFISLISSDPEGWKYFQSL